MIDRKHVRVPVSMAVLSTLRPQLHKYTILYATHRPTIQRVLNAAFVVYFVSSGYRGLTMKGSPKRTGKDKADGSKSSGKQPRVAVCSVTRIDCVVDA